MADFVLDTVDCAESQDFQTVEIDDRVEGVPHPGETNEQASKRASAQASKRARCMAS